MLDLTAHSILETPVLELAQEMESEGRVVSKASGCRLPGYRTCALNACYLDDKLRTDARTSLKDLRAFTLVLWLVYCPSTTKLKSSDIGTRVLQKLGFHAALRL